MRLVPLEVFLGACYFGGNCCEPPMVHFNMKPWTYCPCGNQKSSGSPLPTHGLWNGVKHGISLTATARRNHLPKLSYRNSWSSVVWTHFQASNFNRKATKFNEESSKIPYNQRSEVKDYKNNMASSLDVASALCTSPKRKINTSNQTTSMQDEMFCEGHSGW